ncbi:hypothetical protein LOTGIDRAFT_217135 [Lottia gigantea]|uniref:Neutral alpha-glucosidase AB n=1 Tax=Lottia gigantea TaxID=225164 RepID=V4AA79_LOTGI|nr:hypothetical protein LOTGIDRAFT_217135 [Lottia gigantea]ESO91975.1 hypothetical protein LOTGIDRAFT_217135 [Lottia gigantea]
MAMSTRCAIARSKMSLTKCFILLSYFICQLYAVQRDNFKTCEQSSFCKRQRAYQPAQSPYVALEDSLKITSNTIDIQLLNKDNNVRFLLTIFGLQDNMFRIKMNELSPIKERYEIPVGDALKEEPAQQKINFAGKDKDKFVIKMSNHKLLLSLSPFRIDAYTDETPVMSLNSQGLLKFEQMRIKPEAKPPADDSADENGEEANPQEAVENQEEKVKEEKKEDETGMWEETFKTFTDSKPHGPSSIGIDVSFPGFENVYGIPEHADTMALKTTKSTDPYRLFNLDVFEYDLYNPMALYGAVPLMYAHNEDRTVGIFWHNAAETWIDISSNTADKSVFSHIADFVKGNNEIPQTDTHWFSESGVIDVFLLLGPTPRDVFKQYSRLTGTTQLPPLYSLAYHQCRWNYNDQDDVKAVDANFDKFDIPFDVIWLDIEHTDGKKYFTWAHDKFPTPEEMIKNLSVKGRKLVTIVDPHLKREDGYSVYTDARDRGFLIKNKDGNDYEGWCWPGSSSWPDFTNPVVREWWADKFALSEYKGSTPDLIVWNDMNEPSVFNGPEITFHKDVKHYNNFENRDLHNIYGMYVHQATMEGLVKRSGGKERSFVLTRAFFAGSQRYSAVWTGDNIGEWSHLKVSIPMVLSLNLAGITFSGADVGGFFKNPDPELLTRWYQTGAFYPFFRAHAHLDTRRREPYLLPEENIKIVREALRLRYSLLPYYYTLFYQAEEDGLPIFRPLWVDYPKDKDVFKIDDQFLIGSSLLVKPVTDQGQTNVNVYFPGKDNVWYDIDTYQTYDGSMTINVPAPLDKIPVYQKGGSIIARKLRPRRSSSLMYQDPFTLIVCLDKQGKAEGELYVDDYHSFQYKNGDYIHRQFIFNKNTLSSKNIDPKGQFNTREWIEKIIIVGFPNEPKKITIANSSGENSRILGFQYNENNKSLTIRKPGDNIADIWTLVIV